MTNLKRRKAIGLMSGTSMDGIDAALVETDGTNVFELGPFMSISYDPEFRERLKPLMGQRPCTKHVEVERDLTLFHADAVNCLLRDSGMKPDEIDIIGFHGQTVLHEPKNRLSYQIGDASLLASETGIDVIANFRAADLLAGGEGAPLAPIFHVAMTQNLERPLVVLNLGGVANVTWVSPSGDTIAFDTGPGNAMIDDVIRANTGRFFDQGGELAAQGDINKKVLTELLDHPYFERPPPKSLDRDAFSIRSIQGLSLQDSAATLTAFTAVSISRAQSLFPAPPLRWLVTGGGRLNPTLIKAIGQRLSSPMVPVEAVGWNGDAIEAQAFAYLAVRSLCGLPLSYPQTTGVPYPVAGGVFHSAKA